MSLSDSAIRSAKPKEKAYKLFDGQGLYLEVSPIGSKYWRLKYRFAEKEKRLSIGVYPAVSLKGVRQRNSLPRAIDPSANKQAVKTAAKAESENSYEEIAREWYTKYPPCSEQVLHGSSILQGNASFILSHWSSLKACLRCIADLLLCFITLSHDEFDRT
jgi:hypothetical protein